MHNKSLHKVAFLMMVAGGLNWLLVGLLEMNVVNMLLGSMPMLERSAYVLVGLSTVYELITHRSGGGA